MKLITNTQHDSVIAYFPAIVDDGSWTLRKPKAWTGQTITIPSGKFKSYFVVKVMGDVADDFETRLHDYEISSESDAEMRIMLYDYLDHSRTDIQNSTNPMISGTVGNGSIIHVSLEKPATLIGFVFSGYAQVSLTMTPSPEPLDCTGRWIRDWTHRIDGTSWAKNGKVYVRKSLDAIGRRLSEN